MRLNRLAFYGSLGLLTAYMLMAPAIIDQTKDPGEVLARQYCSSCHEFPDPEILTKRSWNYLLTDMGFRLGIVDYQPIANIPPVALLHMNTKEQILKEAGLIPDKPLISKEDWESIRKYYSEAAPKRSQPQPKKPRIIPRLNQFTITYPDFQPKAPVFTLTRIFDEQGGILLGNQKDLSLTVLNQQLEIAARHVTNEVLVDAEYKNQQLYILSIGDLMGRNIGVGNGILHAKDANQINFYTQNYFIKDLHRPVDVEFIDLDQNGSSEIIISNFGDVTGDVSLYSGDGALIGTLINTPGAIRSQVHDFNQDGNPDIAVLLGDARENISLLLNQGQNQFERKIVVECHSAYGHTYFELQDFNQDGYMDFLTANGDTDADPFNTLKNYHGVRIYMNDGNNNFDLAYFYPMYGSHFAKAADFDGDGDLDIAASAFFPDFSSNQPEQFVYLENQGNFDFRPFTHPETYQGRWMTMDVGDYDLDGDADVVLGGGYLPLGMQVDYYQKYQSLLEHGKALLVFENKLY